VDPLSRRRFWDLIYGLSDQGVTVFVTTHYMDEAEYCDRLGLIYRGALIALGTPSALKKELMLDDVFEVFCERAPDAMADLEKLPGVKEVALFGRGIHAVAGRGAVDGGVPSLEDVFVSLIEAHDRAERPQEEVKA
jgi:ABC-2 type transport system ATP-binding protein